jgi:hypothetical protein
MPKSRILKELGAKYRNMNDVDFLTASFSDSEAVFLMLPPDKETLDFGAFQDQLGEIQIWQSSMQGLKILYLFRLKGL